ncbi:hypothetical protein [Paenimyroides aestuarii]|uniref:Uncharacterized protein n=1 Tax=Paenimyroides aestuarii TaxID=2968490 RepID=A0ABY5NSE6_9FLAO|nr:hypothetical protein [Paenimyroides aestuarii]UUV21500.1 hypothetical protein NPX36_00125 [Paenimyroides aestuarii]
MIKDEIGGKKVKALYYYNGKGSYDLKLLIELEENVFLFFNSLQFKLLHGNEIFTQYNWKLHPVTFDFAITSIKEEELTTYFVLFENGTILYIYQRIIDLENWYQDFDIVNKHSSDYNDVKEHMEEEWVEEV